MKRSNGFLVILLVGLSACSLYRARDDAPLPVETPPRFSRSGTTASIADRWWEDFRDEELSGLIEQTLSGNLDLRAAWARLDQAMALARKARGGLWPEVDADTTASRTKSIFFAGEELGERRFRSDRLVLALGATYEVDLWRRVWSLDRASRLELRASRGDLETMAMTLAAEMADAWVRLVEQQAQRELLASQVDVGERFLRLTELRFSQGISSALDVYQQRQQLASTRAQVPLAEAQIGELTNRIAVLRGEAPGGQVDTGGRSLPELPPLPSTGLPANLLGRRPDLRAAELRVAAADHRVAAAIADRLPAIRLTAETSYQSFSPPENLFDASLWNLVGNLTAPMFDAGRRRAEVDRTKAVVAERLYEYGQVFVDAVKEVEDALVLERGQREHLTELRRQVAFSRRTLEQARSRYVGGLGDYLPVLTALESLQQAERSELAARRELLSFRIQLYRALGGSWTGELERGMRISSASKVSEAR